MRKPLAKVAATGLVRGLGMAIKPRPFRSRGLAQEIAILAPLPASEPSKPPFTLRLRPAELSHMKGTIHPNPPAQHLPFQGEAGRGCESHDFSVQPLPCSPPRRSTVPFECIDWRRSYPQTPCFPRARPEGHCGSHKHLNMGKCPSCRTQGQPGRQVKQKRAN